MAGRPLAFVIALGILVVWLICGFIFGFTDTWMLIINTVATINASLMVLIIQNTQNRESKALHLKIDELLLSIKEAKNELIAIEEVEEDDLDDIKKSLRNRLKIAQEGEISKRP